MALVWCAGIAALSSVDASYHPMLAKGDIFNPLRRWAVLAVFSVAVVMLLLWSVRRPLSRLQYKGGILAVVTLSAAVLFPSVDSGYREVFSDGSERYEIPWWYDPVKIVKEDGTVGVWIRVSAHEGVPRYRTRGEMIRLALMIGADVASSDPPDGCREDTYGIKCTMVRADRVYYASAPRRQSLDAVAQALLLAPEIFESFKVSER